MNRGQQKLESHRTRHLKQMSPSAYSKLVGLPPQRIANLIKGGNPEPTVKEAVLLYDNCRIPIRAWAEPGV